MAMAGLNIISWAVASLTSASEQFAPEFLLQSLNVAFLFLQHRENEIHNTVTESTNTNTFVLSLNQTNCVCE